jgi:hypothetical protein
MGEIRNWKPSPSMVVALIALAVALGGTANAMRTAEKKLPPSSPKIQSLAQLLPAAIKEMPPKAAATSVAPFLPKAIAKMPEAPAAESLSALLAAQLQLLHGQPLIGRGQIENDSINGSQIQQLQILQQHLADNAVGPSQIQDANFTNATMSANWTAPPSNPPRYSKDAQGVVHLEGVALKGAGAPLDAFTLPSGIAPGATSGGFPREFVIVGDGGAGCIAETPAVAILDPASSGGKVSINNPGNCLTYYLDGITYTP